jgi:hypothetical protein
MDKTPSQAGRLARALSSELWALSLELADPGIAVARSHREFQRALQL